MILKRILSNIIDLTISIIVLFIVIKFTKIGKINYFHEAIFIFIYCTVYLLPIALIKNTFGKKILKLEWQPNNFLRSRLFIKYLSYLIIFGISNSLFNIIQEFPNSKAIYNQKPLNSLYLSFSLIISDSLIFLLSIGKYHFLDFLLNIQINNYKYIQKPKKYLLFSLLFLVVFVGITTYSYHSNFSYSNNMVHLSNAVIEEPYPKDLLYGEKVISYIIDSEGVLSPSNPYSFIYENLLSQKTLLVHIPFNAFNSLQERERICLELIKRSVRNDYYFNNSPDQTRIILSSFDDGYFLNKLEYYYIYYFDNKLPEYGIYGGFIADSTKINEYDDLSKNFSKKLHIAYNGIKDTSNISYNDFLIKLNNDRDFSKSINDNYFISFNFSIKQNNFIVNQDSISIIFKQIPFNETVVNGYSVHKIPFGKSSSDFIINAINSSGEQLEIDENINKIKFYKKYFNNKF